MFYVGLDLGQRRDHSAIAVIQKKPLLWGQRAPVKREMLVRYVERIPLGTPYPNVVAKVRDLVQERELMGECGLTVDATGVGAPVVEMLRGARLGCEINAVNITGGDRETCAQATGGPVWNVPKQDLISGLHLMLERGELRIAARMRDSRGLVRELVEMQVSLGRQGAVKLGADLAGSHDDMVIALALACWRSRRKELSFGTRRLPGI